MILLKSVGSYSLIWLQKQDYTCCMCAISSRSSSYLISMLRFLAGVFSLVAALKPGPFSASAKQPWRFCRGTKLGWCLAAVGMNPFFLLVSAAVTPAPISGLCFPSHPPLGHFWGMFWLRHLNLQTQSQSPLPLRQQGQLLRLCSA